MAAAGDGFIVPGGCHVANAGFGAAPQGFSISVRSADLGGMTQLRKVGLPSRKWRGAQQQARRQRVFSAGARRVCGEAAIAALLVGWGASGNGLGLRRVSPLSTIR